MDYSIRDATPADLDAVLALNQSEVPHVGSVNLSALQAFLAKAVYFRVAVDDNDVILAFLVGLAPNTDYASLNYRWFSDRYDSFAYIDRIAVAPEVRRLGIAAAMYEDFAIAAAGWSPMLCCEVNLLPPNPGSMAFHQRIGFSQAGTLETVKGAKKVAMLVKEIG
jgi:predicted GNAT superfamily acetyltransferase